MTGPNEPPRQGGPPQVPGPPYTHGPQGFPPHGGPPTGPPPRPSMPVDVGTARQLWWGIIAFGVLQMLSSVLGAYGQRRSFAEEVFDRAEKQGTPTSMATIDLMVSLTYVFVVLLGLGAAVIGVLIVHQFAKGKLWARTVLTVVGVWFVFSGVGALFSIGMVTGAAALVAGGASIVQAVLVCGAIFLSHRAESTAYFQPGPRPR